MTVTLIDAQIPLPGVGRPKRQHILHAAAMPQMLCDDCSANLPAMQTGRTFHCVRCGNAGGLLHRDMVPYSVWVSLADNEDRKGRVPTDSSWDPTI